MVWLAVAKVLAIHLNPCILIRLKSMNDAYEYYAKQVGGLTEDEINELEESLENHQLTEQDIDQLYIEVSGQEHDII